jgi:hypothetical protein
MFGASGWLGAYAMAKANKEIKENIATEVKVRDEHAKTLACSVIAWWEEHKDDMYIASLDRDCDYKLYPKEPEFVMIAFDIINSKNVL